MPSARAFSKQAIHLYRLDISKMASNLGKGAAAIDQQETAEPISHCRCSHGLISPKQFNQRYRYVLYRTEIRKVVAYSP
jgi:hypothetical protein